MKKHLLLITFFSVSILSNAQTDAIYIKSDGNVGIGSSNTANVKLDVAGAVAFREGALTLANGANNDIALTGDMSFYQISGPTAAFSVSGFAGGVNGRVLTLVNNTTQQMTIVNLNTSAAGNQIRTLNGGNLVSLSAQSAITLHYSSADSKWQVTATRNFSDMNIPSGMISMWSGTLATIPTGWLLCDGTNGTPNLLDKFIINVPNAVTNPGTSGGSHTKTLTTTELPAHTHTGTSDATAPAFTGTSGSTSSVTPTFTGTAGSTSSVTPTFTGTAGSTNAVTPTFTGTANQTTSSVTPTFTGTANQTTSSVTPTFTGTAGTSAATTPTFTGTAGTTGATAPTFTGTLATSTATTPTFTGTGGTTGAEAAHTHGVGTLAIASNGAHTHNLNISNQYWGNTYHSFWGDLGGNSGQIAGSTTSSGAHTHTISGSTAAGSSHTHSFTPAGSVSSHTHDYTPSGSVSSHTHSFTPAGTVSSHTHGFTPAGTISAVQPTFTATGTISAVQPTFTATGTISSITHTFTPAGTISTVGPLSYTPAGTISTVGPLSYTPAGTVSSHTHTFTTNSTGSGSAFDIRPAYYTLAYIIKQ